MAELAVELQRSIFGLLASGPFQAAIGGATTPIPVLDRVPQSQKPPYIKIGDDHIIGDLASGYDGSDTQVTITVWSPGPGKIQAKTIAGAIRAFLTPQQPAASPFTLTGHHLVTWSFDGVQFLDDTDGLTTKAIVVMTFVTYPTA